MSYLRNFNQLVDDTLLLETSAAHIEMWRSDIPRWFGAYYKPRAYYKAYLLPNWQIVYTMAPMAFESMKFRRFILRTAVKNLDSASMIKRIVTFNKKLRKDVSSSVLKNLLKICRYKLYLVSSYSVSYSLLLYCLLQYCCKMYKHNSTTLHWGKVSQSSLWVLC